MKWEKKNNFAEKKRTTVDENKRNDRETFVILGRLKRERKFPLETINKTKEMSEKNVSATEERKKQFNNVGKRPGCCCLWSISTKKKCWTSNWVFRLTTLLMFDSFALLYLFHYQFAGWTVGYFRELDALCTDTEGRMWVSWCLSCLQVLTKEKTSQREMGENEAAVDWPVDLLRLEISKSFKRSGQTGPARMSTY